MRVSEGSKRRGKRGGGGGGGGLRFDRGAEGERIGGRRGLAPIWLLKLFCFVFCRGGEGAPI